MLKFTEMIEQDELDDKLYDEIIDFLIDLDVEELTEDQQNAYYSIMGELFDGEDEYGVETADDPQEMGEAFARKKVRISPAEKAKRKRLYRKGKSKAKIAGKKRRKTASFKRYSKKAKRMSKQGKTSTGKRQTKRV